MTRKIFPECNNFPIERRKTDFREKERVRDISDVLGSDLPSNEEGIQIDKVKRHIMFDHESIEALGATTPEWPKPPSAAVITNQLRTSQPVHRHCERGFQCYVVLEGNQNRHTGQEGGHS